MLTAKHDLYLEPVTPDAPPGEPKGYLVWAGTEGYVTYDADDEPNTFLVVWREALAEHPPFEEWPDDPTYQLALNAALVTDVSSCVVVSVTHYGANGEQLPRRTSTTVREALEAISLGESA